MANTIEVKDGQFEIRFKYDETILGAVRLLPGRKWNADGKFWSFPATPANLEIAKQFAREHGFSLTGEEVINARGDELLESSAAAEIEGELVIPGLVGTLRPFQKAGVAYVLSSISKGKGVIIGDQMGLGKTLQAIAVLAAKQAFPALIVCPAVLKENWKREIEHWLPGRSVLIVSGKTLLESYAADFVIVNYDILEAHRTDSPNPFQRYAPDGHTTELMKVPFRGIVADESHYIKDYKSRRSMAVRLLFRRRDVRLCLTGTPIKNRPGEIINQLSAIGQVDSLGGFQNLMDQYVWSSQTMTAHEYGRVCEKFNYFLRAGGVYLRRLKEDVLKELPPKQRTVVPLTPTNAGKYERASKKVLKEIFSKGRVNQATAMTEIDQLKLLAAEGKLKAVVAWIEEFLESGEKIVVFAHHIAIQEKLAEAFPGCVRIAGGMSDKARQAAIDDFQNNPGVKVCVASIQAAGVGLTLTAASDVAFIEFPWTPADADQAEDRCHRLGQLGSVNCWYFTGIGTVDEDIVDMLESKRKIFEQVADGRYVSEASGNILTDLLKRIYSKAHEDGEQIEFED